MYLTAAYIAVSSLLLLLNYQLSCWLENMGSLLEPDVSCLDIQRSYTLNIPGILGIIRPDRCSDMKLENPSNLRSLKAELYLALGVVVYPPLTPYSLFSILNSSIYV